MRWEITALCPYFPSESLPFINSKHFNCLNPVSSILLSGTRRPPPPRIRRPSEPVLLVY
jgi:hypothetical protein